MHIAIVGRANVGKSTLFNRLLERPKAIVSPIAGTTRDRNYGRASWRGEDLILVDTGGLEDIAISKIIAKEVKKQVDIAIKKADLIFFLVDLKDGLLPGDVKISKFLKKLKKRVLVIGNKADSPALREKTEDREWLKLTFGKPLPVSAITGAGAGDLLDEAFTIIKTLEIKKPEFPAPTTPPIKVAIVGKPNVGKSSLLNSILGEERVLVSEIPFTTREPQDTLFTFNDQPLLLVDTVGIRKKARIEPGLEKMGVRRSIAAIERADVVLFVTEVNEPLTSQDKHLAELILEKNASLIILANKWDLVPQKEPNTINRFTDYYRRFFPSLTWAPILFISAKTGEKVKKILDLILRINQERNKFLKPDELKKFLNQTLAKHWATIHRRKKAGFGARPKIINLIQVGVNPPTFHLITASKEKLPEGFVKFIEKRLREQFGFWGAPIKLEARQIKK
jgi:GTP-binding protein